DDLGAGSIADFIVDVAASNPVNAVAMVAANNTHSLALKPNGSVWAWGFASLTAARHYNAFKEVTPVLTILPPTVALTAGSWDHSIAVALDGSAWGWGNNQSGELGDGHPGTFASDPVKAAITDVVGAAAGDGFSLFLKRDRTVWAVGSNRDGRL